MVRRRGVAGRALPPAPQEEHFKASKLAAYAAEMRAREKARASEAEARAQEAEERRDAKRSGRSMDLATLPALPLSEALANMYRA